MVIGASVLRCMLELVADGVDGDWRLADGEVMSF